MSGRENIPGGFEVDEAARFAELIERKIDLLHVSAGFGEENFPVTHPPMFAEHGVNVYLAAEIKKHVTVPVATVGALNDPAQMEEIISSGKADIVCLARALLADPFLPRKVVTSRDDEIVRCLRCFTCHAERMLTQTRICAVNPVIGREYEAKFETLHMGKPKKVLVAGGGPGGLQAALTAARRGHTVTLCEAKHELGGALLCERGIDFKRESLDYVATMERQLRVAGVQIRLNVEVTPALVRAMKPDSLVIAVGAEPMLPPIPGVDLPNVIIANYLPQRADDVGARVVILGGGLVGCETAVHLAETGHEVTVIEMGERVAPDANPRHRPILLKLLGEIATVRTSLRGAKITAEGLRCDNGEFFPADTVIIATGQRPKYNIADGLRRTAPEVSLVGDCVSARNIREATFRGYHAALDI
jgi:NADPH-dependent 2,4-dienoyl-CoA reductase/sulfur reductase-like enzyme